MDRCYVKNKVLFVGVLECITQFLTRNMSTALGTWIDRFWKNNFFIPAGLFWNLQPNPVKPQF